MIGLVKDQGKGEASIGRNIQTNLVKKDKRVKDQETKGGNMLRAPGKKKCAWAVRQRIPIAVAQGKLTFTGFIDAVEVGVRSNQRSLDKKRASGEGSCFNKRNLFRDLEKRGFSGDTGGEES